MSLDDEPDDRRVIRDGFPFEKLECQYFEICKFYQPEECKYSEHCDLRRMFNLITEPYVSKGCLEFQIQTIVDEDDRKNGRSIDIDYED